MRKAFLIGNKISKYLGYTIGEIAGVVFGTLIALQINRWNETKHTDQFFTYSLKFLKGSTQYH